jgi:hypothetical protein
MAIPLLLVGIAAGIASGMFGIGGGVIIVPALVTLLGFDLLEATGTSLAALLMPVGIFAVIAYYRAGKLHIPTAAWIALGLIGGAWAGAQLALSLPVRTLQQLYGIFLIYAGWRFAEPRIWLRELRATRAKVVDAALTLNPSPERRVHLGEGLPEDSSGLPSPSGTPRSGEGLGVRENSGSPLRLLLLGLLAGVASGMFGIGGGIIIVPALVGLFGFEQKAATGTSLAVLLLPVSLGAVLRYVEADKLDIAVAAWVALGLLFGAFVGARIALALPSKTVRRIYGLFLFGVAARFLLFG